MNPAPDAELASVGEFYHNWITMAVTNLVFKRLAERREAPRYRWDALLNPEPSRTFAVASQLEQRSRTVVPNQVKSKAARTSATASQATQEPSIVSSEGLGSAETTPPVKSAPSVRKPRKNGKTSSTRSKTT